MSTLKPIPKITNGQFTHVKKLGLKLKTVSKLRDFSDAFLKEVYATNDPKSAFYGKLGGKHFFEILVGCRSNNVATFHFLNKSLSFKSGY